jgi:hypothetical protein
MWFSAVCTSRPKSLEPQLNLLQLFIAQQFKARTCATKCLQQVLWDAIVILIRLDVDVRGLVHHSTIHKEKINKTKQSIKILLFHIYMKLNMFRATHRPSSGAQNCTGCLWFFVCAWQRPPTTRPTTFHVRKTGGCQCSFRLLMMGCVARNMLSFI